MMMLRNKISHSLKKIISQSQPQSPQRPPTARKLVASLRLQSIGMRKLQPFELQKKPRLPTPKNPKKVELKRILTKFDHSHAPKNASRSRYQSILPNHRSFVEGKNYESQVNSQHLSYNELVLKREKLEDNRRMIILKQVIRENVKKKNEQMKLRSKKRLKTVM